MFCENRVRSQKAVIFFAHEKPVQFEDHPPLICVGVLCIFGAAFSIRDRPQSLLPTERLTIVNAVGEQKQFSVELAITSEEQERGLMYRRSLAPAAGMLFIFPKRRVVDFWMKNTILPLDMVFIRQDGVVDSIARDAVPFSLANIMSTGPVIATLEVPAGTTRRDDLRPGDKVIAHQFEPN